MKFWRRFVGAIVLLLSTIGLVSCLAGLVGIWMLQQTVYEKVQKVASRLEAGFQRAAIANQNVERALKQAHARVNMVRKESADLGGDGKKSRRAARTIRALIQQQAGPGMEELGGRLASLSDSALAVSSLLESFQEVPLAQASRIDSDQLKHRADEAQRFSSILRRLEDAVGDGDTETGRQNVASSISEVDLFLQKCQATVGAWQSDLDGTRDDLAHVKEQILGWLTCAAITAMVLCSWMGAGQVSLLACAVRWCGGR